MLLGPVEDGRCDYRMIHSKLPIRCFVLSDVLSQNAVRALQPSIIRWKWYIITDPEDTSKLHEHGIVFNGFPLLPTMAAPVVTSLLTAA